MRAASERNEGVAMPGAFGRVREAHRVEAVRLRPQIWHVMCVNRRHPDRNVGRNVETLELHVADRVARNASERRDQTQSFFERHFDELQLA
jgi:hypothetical protein